MRGFRKALLSTVLILLAMVIISLFTIEALMHSEYYHCCDNKNRDSLEGTIETLFVGSSEGMNGFNTEIIDKESGKVCYNLCGPATQLDARYALLQQEIYRNPVKTVVMSIEKDSLAGITDDLSGNMYAIPRIRKFKDRINYFFTKVPTKDQQSLYGIYMKDGFYVLYSSLLGSRSFLGTIGTQSNVDYSAKGYRRTNASDVSLKLEEIADNYNIHQLDYEKFETTGKKIKAISDLCHERGIRFIITVIPYADTAMWSFDGWNYFDDYLKTFCEKENCEYYNFDLIKERYSLFNDSYSYVDTDHLSGEGSDVFSKLFCDIIKKADNGEDLSGSFYSSYDEMIEDSPYMEYYKTHSDN